MRYPFAIRLASWLILDHLTQAAFQKDFSLYPDNAQQCLYTAATSSGCNGDTAMAMNSCLCSNGGNFVTKTATCLGSLYAVELGTVYDTMNDHCTETKTPLTVSRALFLKDSGATLTSITTSATASVSTGSMTTTTTGSAAVTSTGEPEATGSGGNNSGGDQGDGEGALSSTARAGIIAGSTSGGLLVLGLMAFFFVRHRRYSQSGHDEAHPMLFQKFGGRSGGGGFDAAADRQGDGERGMDLSAMAHDGLEVADAHGIEDAMPMSGHKWRPSQRFNWESPYEPPWSPPLQDTAPKPGWGRLPRIAVQTSHEGYKHIEPQIHELASPELQAPIEMAATPLDGQQYSGAGWGAGK